jgi:uncharacterized protein (TIGR02453 family)
MTFDGFPTAALDFYDDLELDNTKSFWEAHKAVYAEAVKAPMTALTEALGPEFGSAKIFRPYRDVRFAKDKTPYKTHQGAFVAVAPATGWYLELSARGVRTGAGFYEASGERMAAFRTAIDDERRGTQLASIIKGLEEQGFEIGGEQLKTAPRGFDKEHPRIALLRHKQLFAGHQIGFEPVIHTAELVDLVREDWRRLRPLVDWLTTL